MSNIKLLDTTLRDGMNVTDFYIDDSTKSPFIKGLESSGVDIIEVGFLRQGKQKADSAEYESVENINQYIAPKKPEVLYAAICTLFDSAAPQTISPRSKDTIDIVRVAAFKHGMSDALKLVEKIKSKGYEVMLQPSRTSDYSEREMVELINEVNALNLYSFALVDTFGNMYPNDVLKLVETYNSRLSENTHVCYHFHNNSQLAFANAITAVENTRQDRTVVLDASVFGMGCGAGNLPSELAMKYLNEQHGKKYDVGCIFELYERYFLKTFKESHWGYQPRNYLTAQYNVQPYYGVYLEVNYGFTIGMLEAAFKEMQESEKVNFVKGYADEIGKRYS